MSPFALLLCFTVPAYCFRNPYPATSNTTYRDYGDDPGSPLFLTPYIEQNNIEEARKLAYVDFPGFPKIKSYAGFFTVDKKYDSNQFFWYFPAEQERTGDLKSALYLWLQGGPGGSSLFGLFTENGVFQVEGDSIKQRDLYWSKNDHVIYIDNPVGTGYSFTNDSRGYCTNETQIGEHLYSSLLQFFQLFPELLKYDFIISGESYAGKYIPALGHTIHKNNPTAKIKINLKGLMIGDGWSDPVNQHDYADYLYQIGLLDWNEKKQIEDLQTETVKLIEDKAWKDANVAGSTTLDNIQTFIGKVSLYNFMITDISSGEEYIAFIQKNSYRRAIHVGSLPYGNASHYVLEALAEDLMQSVAPWISELLEHYHMLFYNGQVDIIVAYPLTLNFLRKLKFSGSEDYLKAPRELLYQSGKKSSLLAGYTKAAANGKLMDALIRSAGHMVPIDQPASMLALMDAWRRHIAKNT